MDKRTIEQNKKLWPLLHDVAAQVYLEGKMYDADDWKTVFMSALNKDMKWMRPTIKGIYGEPVNLGRSTSKLSKEEFSNLIEIILAYGASVGVKFSGPQD